MDQIYICHFWGMYFISSWCFGIGLLLWILSLQNYIVRHKKRENPLIIGRYMQKNGYLYVKNQNSRQMIQDGLQKIPTIFF